MRAWVTEKKCSESFRGPLWTSLIGRRVGGGVRLTANHDVESLQKITFIK